MKYQCSGLKLTTLGYDATGKETKGNELPAISEELVKFIKAIEEGNDRFFQ